jgi:LL-diaminopimelate aminotransferase
VINYPNNPTCATATLEFFKELVDFAKKHNLIVVQDAAYASLVFEGKPTSFLEVEGALEVGVELHSLSKSYNMTGWRIGFVVGNELIVKAYSDMKDNSDSGQFLAIQKAAVVGLDTPVITEEITAKYSRRMDLLTQALNDNGFQAEKPAGSFFLYVKAPMSAEKDGNKVQFQSGEEFSQWLIKEHLISTVPWDDVGNYIRFSVTFAAKGEEEEKAIISEIQSRLAGFNFCF